MRFLWIIVTSSILISMGVLIVITGQHQMITIRNEQQQKLSSLLEQATSRQRDEDLHKSSLEIQVKMDSFTLKVLGAEVDKLDTEQKKKKVEVDTCQAEKEAKQHELEKLDQTMNTLIASLKAESDVWSRDKETLKGELTGYRDICEYVQNSSIALKRCGTPPS